MKMNFTVYSKDGCPYCNKIVQFLEQANLSHVVYKLNDHFTKEQFYHQFGEGSTFPQVLLNDQLLGGCADTIAHLLNEGYVKI
jgi:glutaredoxin